MSEVLNIVVVGLDPGALPQLERLRGDRDADMADFTSKTAAQIDGEAIVDAFRRDLGPFVVAAEKTRMPMVFTDEKPFAIAAKLRSWHRAVRAGETDADRFLRAARLQLSEWQVAGMGEGIRIIPVQLGDRPVYVITLVL